MAFNACFVILDNSFQAAALMALLEGLKKKHGDIVVTSVASSAASTSLKKLGYDGNLVEFDTEQLEKQTVCDEKSIIQSYETIKRQISGLSKLKSFDLIVNLGFSDISAVLTSMLEAEIKEGALYDEYGRRKVNGNWFEYLSNSINDSRHNSFNYIDIISAGLFSAQSSHKKTQSRGIEKIQIDLSVDIKDSLQSKCRSRKLIFSEDLDSDSDLIVTDKSLLSFQGSVAGKAVIYVSSNADDVLYYPYGEGNYVILAKKQGDDISEDILSLLSYKLREMDKELLLLPRSDVLFSRLDMDCCLEYVPLIRKKIEEHEFYRWIYRAVFKCTTARSIKVGDPQRFLAFGEKYIDRVVEIDRQVEYLYEKVLTRYDRDSLLLSTSRFPTVMESIVCAREIAFEGQKKAREFLNAVAVESYNMDYVKNKRNELSTVDNDIYSLLSSDIGVYVEPFIKIFINNRDDAYISNLFPLAKRIMGLYEDLFSRISFLEEIIKGLWKRIN